MTVCLFDIDGTLISSLGAGKAALEAALLEEFGIGQLRGTVVYSGRTDTAISSDLLRLHGIDPTPAHRRQLQDAYLRHLPSTLATKQGRVLPGISELLADLRRRERMHLGLLTGNVKRGAAIKLGHYGIDHHFAFGGFGDDLHERDEVAAAALDAAESHLGQRPVADRIWVIGDTPLDVQCARAIGAKVLAVATGMHPYEELADCRPDLLMRDLSDATAFVAQLA